MTLSLISPPAIEPVSLDDMKTHLRLTANDEDGAVMGLMVSARHALEARAGLAFLPQQWLLRVDTPVSRDIILPLTPVLSIDEITLVKQDGTRTVLSEDSYETDIGSPGRIKFLNPPPYPLKTFGGIEIIFTAGHTSVDAVPAELRHAVRLLTGHFFENRESAGENRVFTIPRTIDSLVAPYRRLSL